MRIRKNAKLSPLLFSNDASSSAPLETHVCQLNQSPWDVIPFAYDSSQFEVEDSFTENVSLGDSIGAVESVASMMDSDDKPLPKEDDNRVAAIVAGEEENDNDKTIAKAAVQVFDLSVQKDSQSGITSNSYCQKADGTEGWHSENEPKQEKLICEHNYSLPRSCINDSLYHRNNVSSYNASSSSKKKAAAAAAAAAAAVAAGARRSKVRAGKKANSSTSNPYEFYYYSGFGPLWGKRRGDRSNVGGESHKNKNAARESSSSIVENATTSIVNMEMGNENSSPILPSYCSPPEVDDEELDYMDDEEEEDASGDSGKKRMRKPVKARSLKSLM